MLRIKVWPEPIGSGHTQSHTERKGLVGALVTQERGDGLKHDPRVEGEGAVLGVGEVQVDGLIPRRGFERPEICQRPVMPGRTANLPMTRGSY